MREWKVPLVYFKERWILFKGGLTITFNRMLLLLLFTQVGYVMCLSICFLPHSMAYARLFFLNN